MQLAPGVIVAGRYRLDQLLGEGPMSSVWAATHAVTGRKSALKLVKSALEDRPDLRKRFLREARAASLVNHPNVVRIHDVFELGDGTPIMVMDLLRGETLAQRLAREGWLTARALADVLLPVVSAVGAAHELGIVHRDLKPDNVFLTTKPGPERVKVLDFGIAKLHGDDLVTIGVNGAILGTPGYMAPEQGSGEPDVDHRADVWALGVIAYEALSGSRPVKGENLGQVMRRSMEDTLNPLKSVAPDVPDDVAQLVDRMLVRDRDQRLPDLREALAVLSKHSDVVVPEFGAVGSRAERDDAIERARAPMLVAGPLTSATAAAQTSQATRRRALLLTALAALLLTGLAVYLERF